MPGIMTKLRRHAGLLVISIGVAMGIFVVWDALRQWQWSAFRRDIVARINGEKVHVQEYDRLVDQVREQYRLFQGRVPQGMDEQIHREAFQRLLIRYVMEDALARLMLLPSEAEMNEYLVGATPHPFVQQLFANPETGRFDPVLLNQFLARLRENPTADMVAFWNVLRDLVYRSRVQVRYLSLLRYGWYVPRWLAQMSAREQEVRITARLWAVPFTRLEEALGDTTLVRVSPEEVQEYADAHAKMYAQRYPTRIVRYVYWEIRPSHQDSQAVWQRMEACATRWTDAAQDSVLQRECSEQVEGAFFYRKEALPFAVQDTLWGAEPGTVIGPMWLAEGDYGAVVVYRVGQVRRVADSAYVYWIFRQAVTRRQRRTAARLLDSLRQALVDGAATWDSLVQQYSQDQTTKGRNGEVGWVTMHTAFPELRKRVLEQASSIEGALPAYFVVRGQQGMFLVRVERLAGFYEGKEIARLYQRIEPSTETVQQLRAEVNQFYAEYATDPDTFVKYALKHHLLVRRVALYPHTFTIAQLGNVRSLVQWAFQAEEGEFSGILTFPKHFVVAYLHRSYEPGEIMYEAIHPLVADILRAHKITEYIVRRAGGASDALRAEQVFAQLPVAVDSTQANFTFSLDYLPHPVGSEPIVVGALSGLSSGSVSPLIEGRYVLAYGKVVSRTEPDTAQLKPFVWQARSRLTAQFTTLLYQEEQLRKVLEQDFAVEDFRYYFY